MAIKAHLTQRKKQSGFTLIELSIVLVIIGLIIGGVLIGQDLIKGSEIRSLASQVSSYNSAVNAFKAKYGQLPGDFIQAATYISGATSGDGNGVIWTAAGVPGAGPTYTMAGELPEFWYQLSTLGMLEGNFDGTTSVTLGTNLPYLKTNRGGVVAYGFTDYNNYYHFGVVTTGSTTLTTANVLTAVSAYALDSKLDNGMPSSGTVQARDGTVVENGTATSGAAGGATCTVTGPPVTYNTTAGNNYLCQLRVQFQAN
jgi:prepilin-type N-terminal cleavage/methylation domain-containing protein